MQVIMKNIALTAALLTIGMSVYAGDMSNSIELTQLYIVGDATVTSWDLGRADEFHRIDEGVFEWTGHLAGGKEFKFMNSRDGWHKHIVATEAGVEVKKGKEYLLDFYADWALDGKYDCKFQVGETGEYTLIVDLNSMRMTMAEPVVTAKLPEKIYLTGTAVDDKVIEIPDCHGVEHKLPVYLKAGTVKLMDTPVATDATRYYRPVFDDIDVMFGTGFHTPLFECGGNDTSGWNVALEDYYTVYLDNSSQTYRFSRHVPAKTLYLVGGCCERAWNYWDDSNCRFHPDFENPDIMVWEGELRIGWEKKTGADGTPVNPDEPDKFKILTAQDWFRDTYHPYIADVSAEGTTDARITGGDDVKWTISRDGVYRLELNTKTETLTGTFIRPVVEENTVVKSGVAGIEIEEDSKVHTTIYYNLQGNMVKEPSNGIFVEVSRTGAQKVMIK